MIGQQLKLKFEEYERLKITDLYVDGDMMSKWFLSYRTGLTFSPSHLPLVNEEMKKVCQVISRSILSEGFSR